MNEIRVRCVGYFDEKVKNLVRIGKILDDIASFTIERPEIDVVIRANGEETHVFIAALFLESPEIGMEGWMMSKYISPGKNIVVFCKEKESSKNEIYKPVVLCGAPERIHPFAILKKKEVISLLSSLLESTTIKEFVWLPIEIVVEFPEEKTTSND